MTKIRFYIVCCFLIGNLFRGYSQCNELIWSDEFNVDGLPDASKWNNETGAGGWGNNEWQYYTSRTENSRVENGSLIIEARKESYSGSNYTSARMITYYDKGYWAFGKVEARMKLPYGKGIWPAFWMLGKSLFEGAGWPACGEIDIMELIGGGEGKDDKIYGTPHWADASNNHAMYGGNYQLPAGNFADTFHVFSIEWTSVYIKWFMDGIQYHVIDITPGALNEFQKPFFIIFNLAVGGNWPGYPDGTTVFPQKMEVDYVRVFQKDVARQITGKNRVDSSALNIKYSINGSDSCTYNWSVPADAQIIDGQGTATIHVNWGNSSDTIRCAITTPCGDYNLEFPVTIDMHSAYTDINAKSLNVYPTLATKQLMVTNSSDYLKYSIFNCYGVPEFSGILEPGNSINIEKLNPGVYFIHFESSKLPVKFLKVNNN